jgi:hypothetical protein
VEVAIWNTDARLKREDLAISLADSGTGIGQVLAILYVVVTADSPRIICIDEPNSFLHPGASRALLRILKRFPSHQYVISTHSPEIISELSNARLIRLTQREGRTIVEQLPAGSMDALRAALADVGAKMSDVLGFEHLLWVEGPSDADTFSLLSSQWFPDLAATLAFLPVKHTSDFDGNSAANTAHIYRQVSSMGAPMPPNVRFLFDREGRTDSEIQSLQNEFKDQARFLPRRMLENYFLEPTAIASVIASLESQDRSAIEVSVRDWIESKGCDSKYGAKDETPLSQSWAAKVHAGKLLKDLFGALTEERHEYRKTLNTPQLAAAMPKSSEALKELKVTVAGALGLDIH